MDKEKAKTLLFAVADVLEKYSITYFLDYGTLLGAIREKDFIEHDNDIDLGIFDNLVGNYELLYKITKELNEKGIKLNAIWEQSAISFVFGDISLDLNRYVKQGDNYVLSLFGKKSIYPSRFLDSLFNIEFLGRVFNVPHTPSALLESGYGPDWMTPIKDKKPNNLFQEDRHIELLDVHQLVPIFSKKWHLSKIPKVAHFYWGEICLPFLRYMTIKSFYEMNKDWTIKYYFPEYRFKGKSWPTHEQKYDIDSEDYIDKLKALPIQFIGVDFEDIGFKNDVSEVFKSDYLRLYLLSTEGGLWSDMDILYFKPMCDLPFNTSMGSIVNSIVCISNYGHSIGFMMSSTNNSYYSKLFSLAKNYYKSDNYQSIGVVMLNKEFPTFESILRAFPDIMVGNLAMDVVYAYDASMIEKIFTTSDTSRFTDKSIGIHWYAGHPLAGEAINSMTEHNFEIYDNIISMKLREVCKNGK